MIIEAKVIADSIAPCGERLISIQATYGRMIHAEVMTHRAFSRNASSSRAIPIEKMLERVRTNPAMPRHWGKNQKGMQAEQELSEEIQQMAQGVWRAAMLKAVEHSKALADLGVHKQIANRLTEPFQHMVTLISATEWQNFLHLRYHKDAQPEFQILAQAIYEAVQASEPTALGAGEWHLPYINFDDRIEAMVLAGEMTLDLADRARLGLEILKKVSVGRCARTSYVNQEGKRDLRDDIALHDRLCKAADGGPGHWSPFEHVARAERMPVRSGNFVGFSQYRKLFPNENLTTPFKPPVDAV